MIYYDIPKSPILKYILNRNVKKIQINIYGTIEHNILEL